tara:strand:- start:1157 stop:2407 length:1251 start_codon:yes stop_codon:yes gene_type:complete
MNLESNKSLGIALVMIGRESTIDPLFNYISNVKIPKEITTLNLYIVQSFNKEFKTLFNNKVKEYNLESKYNLTLIPGVAKVNNEYTWEDWEDKIRLENPYGKHRSTAINLTKVLQPSLINDYIHILDDDTIPPINAVKDLYYKLKSDNNIGMTSGLYFCKNWHGYTYIKGKYESKRKLVASINKRKWISSTLDDFINAKTTEVGFIGNGCVLLSSNILQNTLPLDDRKSDSNEKGPDWYISKRVRLQDKKILIVPSVLCKHLNEKGKEVGIPSNIINKIKTNLSIPKKIHISIYDSFIDYFKLSQNYSEVHIIYRKFPNIFENLKETLYLRALKKISNVKFIEKDTKYYINSYGLFDLRDLYPHLLTEYSYEYMENNPICNLNVQTNPYLILTQKENPSFNVINLQNFLNNNNNDK